MAYFARVDKVSNIVLFVHTVDNINAPNEQAGINYLKFVHANESWINNVIFIQTSYNSTFRKSFAGIGYMYNLISDEFNSLKTVQPQII